MTNQDYTTIKNVKTFFFCKKNAGYHFYREIDRNTMIVLYMEYN